MPTEKSRNLVRQEMKQSMVAGLKYQLDLNRAQTQAADTIEEILNWASMRQGPGMQEVDGELYFADTADLAEYRALTAKLQADADAEVKLTTEAIALKAEIDAKRPASDTEIQAYLNK
jgi:t-SNARE complex subunit (syntaxin)